MKYLALLLALSLVACIDDTETDVDTMDVLVDIDRADHTGEIRLRSDNLTVWIRPEVETDDGNGTNWVFYGRTSRNLEAISGFVGLAAVDVQQTSKRKFQVNVNADVLQDAIITGLFMQTRTSAGQHTLRVELEANFDRGAGSSYIYPYKRIELLAVAGKPVFRGTVSTRKDFEWIEGWNDDDSEPTPSKVSDRKFHLDFEDGRLVYAAHPYSDALDIVGETTAGKRYRRDAHIAISIAGLGLTNQNPVLAWPPAECDRAGDVYEVLACGADPQLDIRAKRKFASDLRREIISYHRANEADILAAGGNTRSQALLLVDTDSVEEVVDADNDPNGNDLSQVRVLSHPDVIFPDSDNMWFASYDRATGDLIEIYNFQSN